MVPIMSLEGRGCLEARTFFFRFILEGTLPQKGIPVGASGIGSVSTESASSG